MNDATTRAMRNLWERSGGQSQVKVVRDREGSAEMGETRYEIQRLDERGEIVRRTTCCRWHAAGGAGRRFLSCHP